MKPESVKHSLRSPSSFIVVVLKSLRHRACIRCGEPINSLEESFEHWEKNWDGTYEYKPRKKKERFENEIQLRLEFKKEER
ncbi:hypothetical protein KAW65_00130 [candidate division WOR-3 bacterium]|nr:hypothetical protein [candidate division WOR-3 bacterium]